jgi:anaphase-promoting complex subunit 1
MIYLINRSFALSVGRGMISIASAEPLMAEALPIPPLATSGRVPPNNSIVALDMTYISTEISLWPEFHNGAAAALRVGPRKLHELELGDTGLQRITRNWIIYNKTALLATQSGDRGHAGKLLRLWIVFLWASVSNHSSVCQDSCWDWACLDI